MSENAKRETLQTIRVATDIRGTGDGVRLAQGRFLDELPGAAFAAVTLVWVISSFAGLIWHNLPAELITQVHAYSRLVLGSHALTIVSRASSVVGIGKKIYDRVYRI